MRKSIAVVLAAAVSLTTLSAARAEISHGELLITQVDAANGSIGTSILANLVVRSSPAAPITLVSGNRADYNVSFGPGNNWDNGVLITTVSENFRNNDPYGSFGGAQNATSSVSGRPTSSYYSIATFATGTKSYPDPVTGVSTAVGGEEYNVNVAMGYFPYSKYLGGVAMNSAGTNGGANDLLIASPGITLGTNVIDNSGGLTTIDLRSFNATPSNGILLVNHAKNEDNFALSQPNADGTWTVIVKDNGSDSDNYEQDPLAFVYIPLTDDNVTAMGRITYGMASQVSKGDFTISSIANGRYLLTIAGQNNDTGTLLVSAEGGETYNRDNIVNYQWDPARNGWIIESRDLPNGGLQGDPTASWADQRAFSFAFITAPTPEPTLAFAALPLVGLIRRPRRR